MEKGKFAIVFFMIFVLILGVAASIYMNVTVSKSLEKISGEISSELSASAASNEASFKKIDEWMAKKDEEDVTKEDDVTIAGSYHIRSTTHISDAYKAKKNGDDSKVSELEDRDKETLEMAEKVIDEIIKDGMTDYEKELAVYEWLTMYTTQDRGMLLPVIRKEQEVDNPYGVLKYKNAVCVGYATTFRLFMQMLDIECMVVHNTDNYHSWDLVKLDGEWYHTDVYSDAGGRTYRNFNMSDSDCGNSWDREFFPAATGTKYNYKYQSSKTIKDIYKLPKTVKKMLDNKKNAAKYYYMDEKEAQKNYNITENMLRRCQERIEYNPSAEISFYWDWSPLNKEGKQGYCLGIYVYYYGSDIEGSQEISEEDLEKINKSVEDAFGASESDPAAIPEVGVETKTIEYTENGKTVIVG